jgi:phage major head subunit gpT-like protein
MAVTDRSILENASTTYRELAAEIFGDRPPGLYQEWTDVRPADSKIVEHDVLESMPVVREWSGAKQFGDVQAARATLEMKSHEASFKIKRVDLITDRTGITARTMRTFLTNTAYIYDKLSHEALVANATGYDGVALFSASHPRGPAGATQSNTSTTALSNAQFEAVMIAGASLRDANGEPFAISYDVLRVGPKLAALAREITGSNERVIAVDNSGAESGTRVAAATGPSFRGVQVFSGGSVRVVVDPRLVGTYDDYYYLFDTTRGASALVGYELRAPEAISLDSMDDDARFHRDEFLYSVECDVVFGPGAWQVAYAGIVA